MKFASSHLRGQSIFLTRTYGTVEQIMKRLMIAEVFTVTFVQENNRNKLTKRSTSPMKRSRELARQGSGYWMCRLRKPQNTEGG